MTNVRELTFNDIIARLDITLGQAEDGLFTACSHSEPLFCFDGHSIEALQAEVEGTLRSYAKIFHDLDVQVRTNIVDAAGTVPVERVRPIGRVSPVLEAA